MLTDVTALADRGGSGFCVALADIDFFKRVNDRDGHETGDEVLRQMARHMAASVRKSDALARWGGEEFLFVLTNTDLPQAIQHLERLRGELSRAVQINGKPYPVTMSFGVAVYHPGENIDALIHRADESMYRAKAAGRDCVVASDGAQAPAGGA